ncbi:MAG: DUF2341 domain-containing protein, partial [Methanomicrobiales archaeon]|nr:DUF2341 domain-containing protein [Methanomicrobiales archaeon]
SSTYNHWATAGVSIKPCSETTPTPTPTPTPSPPWLSCNWQDRKKITIDHTKVSATQTDFPVLINLSSDSGLQSHARSDGYDILFTSTDGTTKLSHEIDKYTSSTGALLAWVKVPSLSSTTDTVLYMYYGYPSSPNQQNSKDVWSNSYAGVWHLKEDPSGTAPQMQDSTSNANHGTSYGTMTSGDQVAGKVDGSLDFDGLNNPDGDSVQAPDYDILNAITISAWINWDVVETDVGIVSKRTDNEVLGNWALRMDDTTVGLLEWMVWDGVDSAQKFRSVSTIGTGTWKHVVLTFDDPTNTAKFYINGALDNTEPSFTMALANTPEQIAIGWSGQGDQYFDGRIDEVRLSSTARSAEWIATEYNNQNSPSTFSSLGSEESYVCGGATTPAYVQSKSQRFPNGMTAAITLPGTSIAGDLMILNILFSPQSLSVSSVSDSKSNAYTLIAGPTNVGGWGKGYTYYAKNIAGGDTITIIVTLSGGFTSGVFDLFALEYSGVNTASPLDQTSVGTGNSTALDSGSKTITSAPSLIYGFGADDGTCLADSPYTNREILHGQCAADQTVSSTGSYHVTATQNIIGQWFLQMSTFKGA